MRVQTFAVRACLLASLVSMPLSSAIAAPGPARLISPHGEVTGSTFAFTWASVPTATWYLVWFGTSANQQLVAEWYTAAQAGCAAGGTCTATLTLGYPPDAYNWFIQTWNATGYGPWSAGMTILTRESPPTWNRRLAPAMRFSLVFGGLGVLDRETGLTWQRTPSTQQGDLWDAMDHCLRLTWGGRGGWRLPSAAEVQSLVAPEMPAGHPFNLGAQFQFWTTTAFSDQTNAVIDPLYGIIFPDKGLDNYRAWCVRGPGTDHP
jgi:hypothetical protein